MICEISAFAFLIRYIAHVDSSSPTFRNILSVPSLRSSGARRIQGTGGCVIIWGTDRLSRDVGTQIPTYAAGTSSDAFFPELIACNCTCLNVKRLNNDVISRLNELEQHRNARSECRHTPAHEPGPKADSNNVLQQ